MDLGAPPDPDDPLSQPTRARLFAHLTQIRRPVRTAELAGLLDLHINGVRAHLDLLERRRLVVRGRSSPSRGRPADTWAVSPDAAPFGRAPSGYEDLGRWLARVLPPHPWGGLPGLEQAGREIGRELAAAESGPPPQLETTLAALGFQPAVVSQSQEGAVIRLRNCPYRAAVRENRQAICALHKGISRGLVDVLHPGARLASFAPRDPDEAGCELAIAGLDAVRTDQRLGI